MLLLVLSVRDSDLLSLINLHNSSENTIHKVIK